MLVAGACFQLFYGLLQEITFFWPLPFFPFLETIFTSNPAILSGSEQLYLGDSFLNIPRLRGTVCEPLYLGNYLLAVIPWITITCWRRSVRWLTGGALVLLLLLT